MKEFDTGETRPSRPVRQSEGDNPRQIETQPVRANAPEVVKTSFFQSNAHRFLWVLLAVLLLGLGSATGAVAAYRSAITTMRERQDFQSVLVLTEQFNQGQADMEAGRFESARQRFEFVVSMDPNFPGVQGKLDEVKQILFATSTPTPTPTNTPTPTETATITPTPTLDPRPLQELFSIAEASMRNGDWTQAIETLLAMRSTDPTFQTAQVDGMLFLSLHSRGLDRILNSRDLEGGAYDLSLAENFGPLDSRATWAREMVRLYMYGSAFWEAYPEQAVYYFGQVASAAPYLTDASGWTASARYQVSLVHYGDYLADQDEWCSAQSHYELALSYGYSEELGAKVEEAAYECSPPSATPTEGPTYTATPEFVPSQTPAPTSQPSPTVPQPPTATVSPPTEEPTTQPASPTPTEGIPPTETPSSTPSEEPRDRTETPAP